MDRRAEIGAIGDRARDAFEKKHHARELTISASRQAIQACAASIRATHRGEFEAAELLARQAGEHVATADVALAGHPDVKSGGPLHDAKKELAEAWCTLALVRDDPLPSPEALSIEVAPYCNGLAEAASELRRQLLDRLRGGDLTTAVVAFRLQAAIESRENS